jgi:superfamily II DNA or RNA helicase
MTDEAPERREAELADAQKLRRSCALADGGGRHASQAAETSGGGNQRVLLGSGERTMIKLRPYQLECIAAVEDKFKEGRKSLLAVLPTGGGKTVIFADLARRRLPLRTLVIAHREELISQACDKIENVTGIRAGVDMAAWRPDGTERIVVGGIQTLSRGRDLPGPPFDLMVIDEAHHAAADFILTRQLFVFQTGFCPKWQGCRARGAPEAA